MRHMHAENELETHTEILGLPMRNLSEAHNPCALHGCFTEDGTKHVFQCISKVIPTETCCKSIDMDLRVTYNLAQGVNFNELMTCMDAVENGLKNWFNNSVVTGNSELFECHGNISTTSGSSPHTLEFDTRIEMNPGWEKNAKESFKEENRYFDSCIVGLKEFLVCTRMTNSERDEMERWRNELCPTFIAEGQDDIKSEQFQRFAQWHSSKERLSRLPVLKQSWNESMARLMIRASSGDEKGLPVQA